jgi:hypothetical protein
MALNAFKRPGFKLAQSGVMLPDLQSDALGQRELDLEDDEGGTEDIS